MGRRIGIGTLAPMLRVLKSLGAALPYPLFLRIFYLLYARREMRRARAALLRANIPIARAQEFSRRKRSDVLFILGSGSSINNITADRWEAISKHDSLGLNFWVLHPFVPTFYFFESFEVEAQPDFANLLLSAFGRRASDYAGTLKVVMEFDRRHRQVLDALPQQFRSNLFAASSAPAPARTEEELRYAIRCLEAKRLFAEQEEYGRLFKYASSLSTAIALAAKLRYRKIVLCGVDLRDQRYFFQDTELYPETANITLVPREQAHHLHVRQKWMLPVAEVIRVLRSEILNPRNIDLYVETRSSALFPEIPEAPVGLFGHD